jgi:SAM-dependent methyltransferase
MRRRLAIVVRRLGWRMVPQRYRRPGLQWLRVVRFDDTRRAFESLDPPSLHVVEISGKSWTTEKMAWASRVQLDYPEFDLCDPPAELPGPFDLVICESVLEHVRDPLTAVRTLRRLCKPEGYVYVQTPFLVRLHQHPRDYWRFTPDGMDVLLRSQGLEPLWIHSWGNRRVIVANFDSWATYLPWRSLRDEPDLPANIWALARPDGAEASASCAGAAGAGPPERR